jgi:tetratricopeptide (TPR) repeat protein
MKTVIKCVAVLTIVTAASVGQSQTEAEQALLDGKRLVAQGVTKWNGDLMLEARAVFERLAEVNDLAALSHYYVGYADYRLSLFKQQNRDAALKYLDDGIQHLEQAVKLDEKFADAFALLSSCYGQKIGYDPGLAMQLGPKSGQAMAAAKRLEPENPRVVLLEAISLYFTPPAFGGSKEKALAGFKRAAALFEKWQPSSPLQPGWGKEEAYAWIGLAHLERDEPISAKRAFEKALSINPDYAWVKNELLPKVAKKPADEK